MGPDPHVELTAKRRAVDPEAPKVACVYKITGPGGKMYIGKTSSAIRFRMNHHVYEARNKRRFETVMGRAICKHGRAAFSIECILVGSEEYCYEMEAKLIEAGSTHAPRGYNVAAGGMGQTSAWAERWNASPEGRVASALGGLRAGETAARKANYPARRMLALLKKGPASSKTMRAALGLTQQNMNATRNSLRKLGHHIISDGAGGLFRLVTLDQAVDAWDGGPRKARRAGWGATVTDRVLGALMGGPRTRGELAALSGACSAQSADAQIKHLRRKGYNIENRGACKVRGRGRRGTFHLIQDERHPWLHLGAMDLRGEAYDDRE